jgi:hypothetical protein
MKLNLSHPTQSYPLQAKHILSSSQTISTHRCHARCLLRNMHIAGRATLIPHGGGLHAHSAKRRCASTLGRPGIECGVVEFTNGVHVDSTILSAPSAASSRPQTAHASTAPPGVAQSPNLLRCWVREEREREGDYTKRPSQASVWLCEAQR